MIQLTEITKRYHDTVALNNISLTLPRGEVVGLLGPNGAGKTTILRLVAGFINADHGYIKPYNSGWPDIGYKPERLLFPNNLRVGQYMKMVARISNIADADVVSKVIEGLDRVDLHNEVNKKIKTLTKGMRQRLALAQALLGDPPLLLLDEPTNGLDPEGQIEIHRTIKQLHADGKTVVLCSHQLPEVTDVCTELVILNNGEIHYENSMSEALALHKYTVIETSDDLSDIATSLADIHPGVNVEDNVITLRNGALDFRRQILTILINMDKDVSRVEQKRITLAEVYAEAVQ